MRRCRTWVFCALAAASIAGGAGEATAKKRPRAAAKAAGAPVEAPAPGADASAKTPPATTRRGGGATGGGGAATVPVEAPATRREVVQRESRIEFDERLVQGQTAAGAIYLFQRGESEFRSMVKLPESFRERTVRPLLPPPVKQ